jgi:hypothetical protein
VLDKACYEFARCFYGALFSEPPKTVLQSFNEAKACVKSMFPKSSGSILEEADKFLLLPQEGIDHDVYLDLPPRNGNMIDESPRLPIGNLKRDSHLGREKDVMSIYQLLHTEEEPSVGIGSVVCITGPVGIGKTEVCRDRQFTF